MRIAEPLYCKPIMMERVWGGNRLGSVFSKTLPAGKVIGESWELSDRPEAASVIGGGSFDGKTLTELLEKYPQAVYGEQLAARQPRRFPLLLKYVDAGAPLSVQVHPDDAGARAFNDRGKSECWVIVRAEPGARIVRGFKNGVTRADYQKAMAEDRVEEILHSFEPRAGDLVALPPGMVHAIGAGLVVAEVQQNSDVTLRIYDYKRLGLDGKPRALHVKEALNAIRFGAPGPEFNGDLSTDTLQPRTLRKDPSVLVEEMLSGTFFSLQRYTVQPGGSVELPADPGAPRILMCISGGGTLANRELPAGQTALLPASAPAFQLSAAGSPCIVLLGKPTKEAC